MHYFCGFVSVINIPNASATVHQAWRKALWTRACSFSKAETTQPIPQSKWRHPALHYVNKAHFNLLIFITPGFLGFKCMTASSHCEMGICRLTDYMSKCPWARSLVCVCRWMRGLVKPLGVPWRCWQVLFKCIPFRISHFQERRVPAGLQASPWRRSKPSSFSPKTQLITVI